MRQVPRRDRDGVPWLAGERRLSSKDSIRIESVGRRRWDARLSQEGPELRSLDDRVGRQGQVVKTAAGIESVIETSQAADGADPRGHPRAGSPQGLLPGAPTDPDLWDELLM